MGRDGLYLYSTRVPMTCPGPSRPVSDGDLAPSGVARPCPTPTAGARACTEFVSTHGQGSSLVCVTCRRRYEVVGVVSGLPLSSPLSSYPPARRISTAGVTRRPSPRRLPDLIFSIAYECPVSVDDVQD